MQLEDLQWNKQTARFPLAKHDKTSQTNQVIEIRYIENNEDQILKQ